MRKREMREDGTNHNEKLGLRRILFVSQFTIPDTAGTSANAMCDNTDMRCARPNQASHTPDFSYPLVLSTLFSSSSPSPSFSSTTLPSLQNTKLSHPSPCHDHEVTPSTAYTKYSIHQVQHTPSTAYTKYSIHQVQHTPSTAFTQECLLSLHSHDYELTLECSLQRVSLHD